MENENDTNERVKSGFGKVLNRHGYGFHYSVLKLANELCDQRKSQWIFEAAEFPVQIQNETTRIDFILKLHQKPIYLLAECKRVNPAIADWCFAQAPYVRRNRTTYNPFFFEEMQHREDGTICAFAKPRRDARDACHIAVEVKSNQRGDPGGPGRGEIERAVTQVCRGVNGMIEFFSRNVQIPSDKAILLPVVFTTARLWKSNVDLSSANVRDGTIDLNDADFIQKDWVFYQYHLSPGIKHTYSPANRPDTIGGILDSEYIRTIAIVTASGIESFLKWSSDSEWWYW